MQVELHISRVNGFISGRLWDGMPCTVSFVQIAGISVRGMYIVVAHISKKIGWFQDWTESSRSGSMGGANVQIVTWKF